MSFLSFSLSDWSLCEQVWKECAKTNTSCGCIAFPTIWTFVFAIGISLIILFIAKLTYRSSKLIRGQK